MCLLNAVARPRNLRHGTEVSADISAVFATNGSWSVSDKSRCSEAALMLCLSL